MNERAWGAGDAAVGTAPVKAEQWHQGTGLGGAPAPVAAVLDRVRAWRARQPLAGFPAAAGATDRELARLGRLGGPTEVLREARLAALDRAGRL